MKIVLAIFVVVAAAAAVAAGFAIARDRGDSLVSPGPLSAVHAALEPTCTSCHTPYERIRGAACVRCHALADRLLAQERTRFHAYVGSCVECHVEHAGRDVKPTRMDHDALARLLTERTPQLRDRPLACAGCHGVEDRHRRTLGEDCARCHATETWLVAGYQHPSPRSRACNRCHAAPPSHFMEHFMMSRLWAGHDVAVEQCYACHQPTAWNDIVDRGWIKHH